MHTFEITIQRKDEDGVWPVVVEQSRSGDYLPVRKEGEMHLDEDAQLELISMGQLKPLAYGTILGEALFSGVVYRAFTDALAQARHDDRLRIFLSVEDPQLQSYRWGRLCAPLEDDAWDFLALNQQVPFSLYLPSSTDRRYPAIGQRDLRALVLVARPEGLADSGLDDFDDVATVASVQRALGEIPADVLANVEGAIGLPTLDQLTERITDEHYTLLHIVAHCLVKKKKTILYLADEQNQLDRVTGDELITELRRLRGAKGLPHFAFLCTCESAKPTDEGALGGLAQQLVQRLGMPAVLAMTEKVSIPTAETLAERYYVQLRQHGEVDRALVEACAGLTRRRDINVPALYSRLGGRPLFSDTKDRELTNKEIEFGLDELEKLLLERAPILEGAFATQADGLRDKLGAERTDLSQEAQKKWDEALTEINAISEEVLDLNFRGLALGQTPPKYDGRCPFPGLMAFQADDREFFFGRDQVVAALQERLNQHPFLAVLGSSGSGKSSVVLAGLVPFLQKKAEDAGESIPELVYLTPGSNPVGQLETALASVGDQPAVVVVDQFEELFTLCDDAEQRRTFLERLLGLTQDHSGLRVVITMRADFWGECAPYANLKAEMQAHQELLAPMTTAELRSAMEQQASAVGLRFEADLAFTILAAVRDEPGAMPLLQHLLREMWKRRHGPWLRASEYHELGGIGQAIARTADEVYERLSVAKRTHMRNIFIRLTRLGDEGISGEEYRDTRRRVTLTDLIPAGEADAALIRNLIDRLADARLVVKGVNEVTGTTEVEVIHEALIRHWPRLRGWLDEDRDTLKLHQEVGQAALAWEKDEREDYLIHRGSRLKQALSLDAHPRITLNELELTYIHACTEQAQTEIHITIRREPIEGELWPVIAEVRQAGTSLPTISEGMTSIVPFTTGDHLAYGTKLGKALFTDSIYMAFVQAWAGSDDRLRVSLSVEAPRLKGLRWEQLCAPFDNGQWNFLALEPRVSFSIYIPSLTQRQFSPARKHDLRALALIAVPDNLDDYSMAPFDAQVRITSIRAALNDIPCDVLATVPEAIGPPTLEALCTQLAKKRYNILHVDVHGWYRKEVKDCISVFADSNNQVDLVDGSNFIAGLRGLPGNATLPEFIFLLVGGGAYVEGKQSQGGLAQRLVKELGIPAVIALPRTVPLALGEALPEPFYQRLHEHSDVDRALAEARSLLAEHHGITVPTLYSRLKGKPLFSTRTTPRIKTSKDFAPAFEITIQHRPEEGNRWPVVVEHSQLNTWLPVRSEGTFQINPDDLHQDLADPLAYGEQLGRALFKGTIRDAFSRACDESKGGLRVLLSVEDPALQALHWGRLRDPLDDAHFLISNPDVFFSLHATSRISRHFSFVEQRDLKTLILVANPQDLEDWGLSPFDAVDTIADVRSALEGIPSDTLATNLEAVGPPTFDELRRQIGTEQYNILHIVAYARYSKPRYSKRTEEAAFILSNPDNQVDIVRDSRRLSQLRGARGLPHFALMSPPEDGVSEIDEVLGRLARSFVEDLGMLAVMAMPGKLPREISQAVIEDFYRQLLVHGEVDRALNEACVGMADWPSFSPPLVYSRLKGKPLFYV